LRWGRRCWFTTDQLLRKLQARCGDSLRRGLIPHLHLPILNGFYFHALARSVLSLAAQNTMVTLPRLGCRSAASMFDPRVTEQLAARRSGGALVYSENELGHIDGKVANGLVRHSDKYDIVGVVDSTKAGLDAGEYLDGVKNGIPVYRSVADAIGSLRHVPEYFIYGIAPLASYLDEQQRETVLDAMRRGMNIVNGLPEFFTEDEAFVRTAREHGVQIYDIRKPPQRKDLHNFSGRIHEVKTPVITVFGTDCAVGKRTTAVNLVGALRQEGLNAVFIATGQTGLLQGSKYGVAVDVLTSGFATGEVEHAVVEAYEKEHPDIIVVEGQGALSHPAFTSSSAILKGAVPNAIIIQHPPRRANHCDYPNVPMPSLESEIELIEMFSRAKVIAITINHEDMTDDEVGDTIAEYERTYNLPTTDILKHGCHKLVKRLFGVFPELRGSERMTSALPPHQSDVVDSTCQLQVSR
jgi:uncharacterized NAD-dependent epimerase/dehydratase family protein